MSLPNCFLYNKPSSFQKSMSCHNSFFGLRFNRTARVRSCSTQARDSREREDNFRGGLAYPDVGRSDFMPGNVPSPFGVGSGGFGGGGGNLVGPRNRGFGGWGGMGVGGPRFDPIGPPGLRPPGGLGGLTGGPGGSRFPPGFGGDPDNDLFRPPTGRGDDMFL